MNSKHGLERLNKNHHKAEPHSGVFQGESEHFHYFYKDMHPWQDLRPLLLCCRMRSSQENYVKQIHGHIDHRVKSTAAFPQA